jgi:hypothetical protein
MAGIFISYRRDDDRHAAGRLADELAGVFGPETLFRDIESIAPGQDFEVALNTALASCAVMLVVIGRRWLDITDAQGRRRLEQEGDWVRTEVATALKRGIPVIPVLLEGTPLPRPEQLPADLQALPKRRTLELADTRWPRDVEQIVDALLKVPGLKRQAARPPAAKAPVKPATPKKKASSARATGATAEATVEATSPTAAAGSGSGARWGGALSALGVVAVLVVLNWDGLNKLFAPAPEPPPFKPTGLVVVPSTLKPIAPAASAATGTRPPSVGVSTGKPIEGMKVAPLPKSVGTGTGTGMGIAGSWTWSRDSGAPYTIVLRQLGDVGERIEGEILQAGRAAGVVKGTYNGHRADLNLRLDRAPGAELYPKCQLLRYDAAPVLGGNCQWPGKDEHTEWRRAVR